MKKTMTRMTAAITTILLLQLPVTTAAGAASSPAQIDQLVQTYHSWESRYVVRDTYVTSEEQYYVRYQDDTYDGGSESVPVTVSEAHGYGMLIMACMASFDSDAKQTFDGMVRFYLAHTSDIAPHLMSWQQCDNGTALIDGADDGSMIDGEADSATDGDLDIAYALLLADQIWGSDGKIPYRTLALQMIEDIMTYEVNQTTWTLNLGDWVYGEAADSPYYGATRSSDFILQYMPVFATVTGDDRWMQLYDNIGTIIGQFLETYQIGLLPDFLVLDENGTYQPAPENFLEDTTDGQYAYNSCRTPWRIGMDGLFGDSSQAKRVTDALNEFIQTQTGGDPERIVAGYTLDGQPTAEYSDLCFTAPFLIAAKCSGDDAWADTLRTALYATQEDAYYGDTIKMLCLMADAEVWLVPETALTGDLDGDAVLGIADIVLLLQYLLGHTTLSTEQAALADLHADGTINGMDLSVLRQRVASL